MNSNRVRPQENMSAEEARRIIIKPYITEKAFNLIEGQNMIIFIVNHKATKKHIKAALRSLYEIEAQGVNTLRSIRGKKAIVKFATAEGARDLATSLGLV
ncbi:MAG TPA: 50S ribosomal protein L23 [Candidatus Nitrosopolaris sp.]|nr:50S ribosomal protein L23 [Candidatus Nitrosopolaris sp.]